MAVGVDMLDVLQCATDRGDRYRCVQKGVSDTEKQKAGRKEVAERFRARAVAVAGM